MEVFNIDPVSGRMYVTRPMDREERASYHVSLQPFAASASRIQPSGFVLPSFLCTKLTISKHLSIRSELSTEYKVFDSPEPNLSVTLWEEEEGGKIKSNYLFIYRRLVGTDR